MCTVIKKAIVEDSHLGVMDPAIHQSKYFNCTMALSVSDTGN